MGRSSVFRATRIVFIAGLTLGIAVACDVTSSVDPKHANGVLDASSSHAVGGSGITATVVSWSEIDLAWQRTPSATGYQVFRSTTGVNGSYTMIAGTGATVTSYPNSGLTGSTQYCYKIQSFKTAGKNTTYSAVSTAECATTLPPPIVAPSATDVVPIGSSTVKVTWTDNSSDEDGFRIERANVAAGPWTQAVSAAPNATSANAYVAAEQQVCFRVIAFNTSGSSTASIPDCTTPAAGPTTLAANTTDQRSIVLTWTDNSAVEDGYEVSRLDAAGTWIVLAKLAPNTVNFRDAAVTVDVRYKYRVRASRDGGYSDFSNETTGMISSAAPAAPVNAHAAYQMDTNGYSWWLDFTVWWTDASTNEEGFRIEYSTDGLTGWTLYATADADASYIWESFGVFPPAPSLECYRVVAFNSRGDSNPSNVICVEPWGAPSGLVATTLDQQSIDLSWTDNASFETGFLVLRATATDPFSIVARLPANATSYHDAGLAADQEYWYFITVVYDETDNWSNYSNYANAITGSGGAGAQSLRSPPDRLTPTRPSRVKRYPTLAPPIARRRRP